MKPTEVDIVFDETNNEDSGVTATLCQWITSLRKEDILTPVRGSDEWCFHSGDRVGRLSQRRAASLCKRGASCPPALLAASQAKNRGARGHKQDGRSPSAHELTSTVSGIDFLIAAVIGFETSPPTASSRLLGLSADDAEPAIGTACTQAGGLMAAQHEWMTKRVQHAFAARNGLFGSLLALVAFDDGVDVEETVQLPRGFDPPITDEEIRFKYRKLATSVIDQQRAETAEKLVLGLEQLEDVSELTRELAKPTERVLG
ncbi:hypothetical protein NUW58_g1646 [Xylaria curta]|uniref:Uncharacterized protein n=1 Tax=Xylaria curta TaxID=42375 RepID=A0ACC1PMJ0_9PEZI|nr:hypothetical protein NUW58_g1646 [Xylaria curta]